MLGFSFSFLVFSSLTHGHTAVAHWETSTLCTGADTNVEMKEGESEVRTEPEQEMWLLMHDIEGVTDGVVLYTLVTCVCVCVCRPVSWCLCVFVCMHFPLSKSRQGLSKSSEP